jgi:hypothetical protein
MAWDKLPIKTLELLALQQALVAFQLAWDIAIYGTPGSRIHDAESDHACGRVQHQPTGIHVFLRQQVFHAAWRPSSPFGPSDPPEFAIKKAATWDPADEGFATFFARMTTIWENYQQAKRDVLNDDDYEFSPFDKLQHLRNICNNISKAAGMQCKRMIFHQQLREFLKDHSDLTGLTENDLENGKV